MPLDLRRHPPIADEPSKRPLARILIAGRRLDGRRHASELAAGDRMRTIARLSGRAGRAARRDDP
jgi:hypothetical protein